MALRGNVLHRLCQSLWRANVSGSSRHADVLRLHHWSSSLSQLPHTPSSGTTTTSSLPPPPPGCLPAALEEGSFSVGLNHKNPGGAGAGAVETDSRTLNWKEAGPNILDVHSSLASLRLQEVTHSGRTGTTRNTWDLASWPSGEHTEYVCPSEKLTTLPELAILDQLPDALPYDLPRTPSIVSIIIDPTSTTSSAEISEPTDPGTRHAPKEARKIMKIRRKKMKRHLLKKFRKRMAFTLRKIKRDRRRKKEAVIQARLSKIQDWGESFDARDWVQGQLDRARRGGFYIDVLEKRQQGRQAE